MRIFLYTFLSDSGNAKSLIYKCYIIIVSVMALVFLSKSLFVLVYALAKSSAALK
jgi:hypothetical protein